MKDGKDKALDIGRSPILIGDPREYGVPERPRRFVAEYGHGAGANYRSQQGHRT
jgi:hypothetical protein